MSKVSVVLSEEEQQELQMILADADGEAALRFLKEVGWEPVRTARRMGLRNHLDAEQP